jgi:hypothetical protein
VGREIVNYFSFFKKNALPKIIKRKYLVEYPINIVGKITSEIGVPWLCWTNQIYHSPFGHEPWLAKYNVPREMTSFQGNQLIQ